MLRLCCLFTVAFISLFSIAEPVDELQQAFDLRFADRQRSAAIVAQLARAQFSYENRIKFDYLSAYHLALRGELKESVTALQQLDGKSSDTSLQLAILSTQLSITLGIESWIDSFSIVDKIQRILEEESEQLERADIHNTSFAVINFYYLTQQYDAAISKALTLLQAPLSAVDKCRTFAILLSSHVENGDIDKGFTLARRFKDVCKLKTVSISANIAAINDITIQWAETPSERVFVNAQELEPKFVIAGYKPLIAQLRAKIAQMALELGKLDTALEYALNVIEENKGNGYIKPVISAYKTASEAHYQLGNVDKAYSYLLEHVEMNRAYYDQNAGKQLAIQKAKFEVETKNNAISILDSQNKLLQTETVLATERVQNTLLALALSVVLLAALIYWSWRSQLIHKQLKYAAQTDSLTGTLTRSHFTNEAIIKLNKARESRGVCALVMFDLDYFKRINDNYGHRVGDWTLKETANTVRQILESNTMVGRMAGEEFAFLIMWKNAEEAAELAEKCRTAIENISTLPTKHQFKITASFGVSDTVQVGYSIDNLISAADLALFQSKKRGRNVVFEYRNTMTTLSS
jgi:diguanylate cyclase (GGDEF)-like protein